MNLLFCIFKYFPYGGLQRSFLRIAEECYRRGHSIDVCALSWDGEVPSGWNLSQVPSKSWSNHARACDFAHCLAAQTKQKHYGAVIGFNKLPGLDVYYAGDPCFKEKVRQQKSLFYRLTPRYHLYSKFEQAVFEKASSTEILLVAEGEKKHYIQHYQTPESRFHVLPPGIFPDRITSSHTEHIRNNFRAGLGLEKDTILLLLVGSGFKTKGLDRAMIALSHLPGFLKVRSKLIAIGEDNPSPFVHLSKNLKLSQQVQILPGRHDILNFLLSADLLIHPAYKENTGNILLEAMLAGLPVLTTDTCGFSHYVSDAHAGKVVPSPFRQEMLNQTLVEMLTSPERETWRKNGMQLIHTKDLFSRAEKAADLIETIARQNSRQHSQPHIPQSSSYT